MFMGPYTKRDDDNLQVWAQREYVECMSRGYGFAAHADYWFYKCGNRAYVCDAPTIRNDRVRERMSFDPQSLDWITEARQKWNKHK